MYLPETSTNRRQFLAAAAGLALFATGCGGDETVAVDVSVDDASDGGLRLISAIEGAEVQANPPEDLVILDVRTPIEFTEGHLEGAVMIDFYEADFKEQLAGLDPDVPYLVYCASGARSGQAVEMMSELGFSDVADVDGGVNAWNAAGLPLTTP